jgi:hypothetical protein
MNEYAEFFWKLLQGILSASLPPLAVALTAWLVQKIREMGKQINADTMESIRIAVGIAVDAAEQAGAARLIDDKKTYAIELSQVFLDKQGIKVDVSLLAGLVEAAVLLSLDRYPHADPVITTTTTTTSGDQSTLTEAGK